MPELPAPGATARWGDVALTHGPAAPTRARGSATWTIVLEEGPWRLWATDPASGWWGHTVSRQPDPDDLLLTVGRRPEHWLALRRVAADGGWVLRTDRFATVHATAGSGIVSTFSPATWDPDPDLDWLAVAGFARLGWYPGDRLPVAGCRLLRPATDEVWSSDGTLRPRGRWQGWDLPEGPPLDEAAAADALAEALDPVLDAMAEGGRLGLPVSGGLDSRVTVASLTRPGAGTRDLWAFSYGYDPTSPELRIAREVAAARGLGLHDLVVPPYLFDDLDAVADATEALVDLTLCRQSAMAGALARHTDAVVAAHWGDVWFGAPTASAGEPPGGRLLALSTKRGHEWLTEHLIRPHLGEDPEPQLRELLDAEADRVHVPGDPDRSLLALKTEQWSLRWTQATLRAYRAATEPRLPFYDPRIADLALRLPADLRRRRLVQIEYLRRHAPDLAAVEWQAVETDLFRLRHERTWRLPRRALRRLARTLRPPTGRLRNWEVQLLEPQGRAGVDRWLVEAGAGIHDLVDRAAVTDLVERHRAAPADPALGQTVAALLTLAVWRERFT